ncbi:hypothetical protein COBT_000557 [Conglomerata obtusa]
MLYGEIIIGPPGSGKSTYTRYKKDILKDRNVFTVNLDPGSNKTNFDYDIKTISSTRTYMIKNELGPNYSTKCILKEFVKQYDTFREIIFKNENSYFIFDFPGQVEFLVSDDSLRIFTKKLMLEGMYLVAVNIVDIVFFLDKHTLLSTYLMTSIAMIMLELPHVCVASKCDTLRNYDIINLKDLLIAGNLNFDDKNLFYKSLCELVENEGLVNFEVMDYQNVDAMMYLQMVVDMASGYFYNEEPFYDAISKEKIIEYYDN